MNKNDAAEVLTTALEGGIGYWSAASGIERDEDNRVHRVTLEDANAVPGSYGRRFGPDTERPPEPDFPAATVTSAEVATAIRAVADGRNVKYMGGHTIAACKALARASGEAAQDVLCEIDADIADQIVQYAALGQIIYG